MLWIARTLAAPSSATPSSGRCLVSGRPECSRGSARIVRTGPPGPGCPGTAQRRTQRST